MRYLAVSEMPRRSLWASIRHWGQDMLQWHAVADTSPKPIKTLCGIPYTSEAYRTWDQTTSGARCPECQRLIAIAPGKAATFISESTTSPRGA
jgi:hypothetical protein